MATKAKGDCYEVHAKFITLELEPGEEKGWLLCHGTIINGFGQTIGHCWLEHDGRAYDFSNGNSFEFGADEYRQITQARDVQTYEANDVSVNIVRQGHYGPWP